MRDKKYLVYAYTMDLLTNQVYSFDFIRICSTEEQAKAVLQYEFMISPEYDSPATWTNDGKVKLIGVMNEETYITYDVVDYDDENQPLLKYNPELDKL